MRGFKNFLMRGSLVEIAVGLVVALAFSTLILAFVTNIINPLLAFASPSTGPGLGWVLDSSRPRTTFVDLGGFIGALIYFVVFMLVVYFVVVVPYRAFQRHRGSEAFAEPRPTKTCPACLSDDLPIGALKCRHCGTEQAAAAAR